MINEYRKVEEAKEYLRKKLETLPDRALILGTGLGDVAESLAKNVVIPYDTIPHFPVSTVQSHKGLLIVGQYENVPVMVLQGRFHLYEGYSPHEIVFPIRVLKSLGVSTLILSNAAGGLNPLFAPGDLMLVTDHINFTGRNPLVGPNFEYWGPRFPDMTEPYSKRLQNLATTIALEEKVELKRGIYVGVMGPSMETAAETRMLRLMGADAVGMSTVMEVIGAVHLGMEVLAISVITNVNRPDCYEPVPIDKVIYEAHKASSKLKRLIFCLLGRL